MDFVAQLPAFIKIPAVLTVLTVVFWILPARLRGGFLLVTSLAFAAFFSWQGAIFFLLNLVVVHQAGRYLDKTRDAPRRGLIFRLMLFWLVGSLCAFKYVNPLIDLVLDHMGRKGPAGGEVVTWLIMPLGMSYVVFRMIHYTVERYRGRAPDSSFSDFGAYVLFFPTFLSGPVERFPAFHKQTEAQKPLDAHDINYGLFRIVSGLLKKFLAADPLGKLVLPVLKAPLSYGVRTTWAAMYGLAIQVYMDFSGYTDLALGVSRMFGYKIMENFNLPYFKPNLAEMWRNWHISVYSFIRDYFFFPFFAVRSSRLKLIVGVFLTFVVFMVWHEGSWCFFTLGCYHGIGMLIYNNFQELKKKNKDLSQLMAHKETRPISTFISASYFGFGFIFFVLEMKEVGNLALHLIGLR